jgi:tRNA A37 threonylcarbamoyladenosine dehydratase
VSEAPMFERVVKVHTLVRDGMIGQVLRPAILVIGCGGTGGWVMANLREATKMIAPWLAA